MVKMRIDFWVSEVNKVKFGSAEKMGCECRNVSISQKAQIFGERSILKKCSILYGDLRGGIQFLISENFYMVFRQAGLKFGLKTHFS